MVKVAFKVNGEHIELDVSPRELLINTLRSKLGLTSVKYGCGIGECGACTVLVNGEPVLACLTLTVDVNSKDIITLEGLSKNGLTDIQRAFIEEGAIQCGYCTPGFIIMAEYMLREVPNPTISDVKEYLKGNLCRCTGYINIFRAVLKAAKSRVSR
ncbi:MAG: (2Fe-2S)-binding protein [Desulfurococcaceae archaeon]|jgi:carbon-monoxide dehydrogenase small subunit|nr:(2Fe-2S)-binding protein [Desulfurococcaceae archaeon]